MRTVTFLVLEGVDKGRVYKDLPIPVTIGREEGNGLRLNDERVSRFHAKVQVEDGDIILTDLDSTNGTRVNGTAIQIRRLRAGDQVSIGRTMLLFGTMEEIAARRATAVPATGGAQAQTVRADELAAAAGAGAGGAALNATDRTVGPGEPAELECLRRRHPTPADEAQPRSGGAACGDLRLPPSRPHDSRGEHRRQR